MRAITDELLSELKNTPDIESFIKTHSNHFINKTTSDYLNELIEVKGMSVADIVKKSGLGEYVYKVFKGERNPSRDILISISFGMNLSLEETQLLLRISKFAILDSRDRRDSVIIYSINNNLSVFKTDDLLEEQNLTTLN